MQNLTDDMFIQAALESSSSLEMTIRLVKCYPAIVDRIVSSFIHSLESQLREIYPEPDWVIVNSLVVKGAVNKKKWNTLRITKVSWNQRYFIDFGFDNDNLRALYLGISKHKEYEGCVPDLANKLNREFVSGKGPTRGTEWWMNFEDKYFNWDSDCLLLLYERQQESLNYFIEKFRRLIMLSDQTITEYIQKTRNIPL